MPFGGARFRSLRIIAILNRYLNVKVNIYIKEGGLCLCEIPIKPLTKYEKRHPKTEEKNLQNPGLLLCWGIWQIFPHRQSSTSSTPISSMYPQVADYSQPVIKEAGPIKEHLLIQIKTREALSHF